MTHATPRPLICQPAKLVADGSWRIEIQSSTGYRLAYIYGSHKAETEQRAALIVKAVNEFEINEKARLTLEGLTPGGSEYHKDPERCAEYINRIKHDAVEAHKEVVRMQRKVNTHERAKAALHAAYEELSQKEVDRACRFETLAMVKQALADMEG